MLRFLGLHALIDALIGMTVGVTLILLDIGGVGSLLRPTSDPLLPLILVVVPLAMLFGTSAAASAILTLPYGAKYRHDDEPDNRPEDEP